MLEWLKFLFHAHEYKKIGFRQVSNDYMRWSEREYKCQVCGKTKWVDGRYDYIEG